jgi:hypothetical protein
VALDSNMNVKFKNYFKWAVSLTLVCVSYVCSAVCLDDKLISGYHIPLNQELKASAAVVIGKAIHRQDLTEDSTDPDDITATVWRIQVQRVIHGNIEPEFEIYNPNDSGRFSFEINKTYLLFITIEKPVGYPTNKKFGYWASPCGSSGEESQSKSVLMQLGEIM